MSENGFTIPTFLRTILVIQHTDHASLCETLLFEAEAICSDLLRHSTSDSVFSWAFATVKNKLCQEVVALTHPRCRLHFNASKTTSEYLEGSFIQTAAQKIEKTAPYLWSLVTGLLDANPARRHAMPQSESRIIDELAAQTEGDLGEIGGEEDDISPDEDEDNTEYTNTKAKKHHIRAAS